MSNWETLLEVKNIQSSSNFTLKGALGNPVEIRHWIICKLPNDDFSINNAIILTQSNKFPLMIDPEGQANAWIRSLESNEGDSEKSGELKVVKQTDATFVRTIEMSVQFGNQVLLENVPEELDPVLESVLLKQIVKQGGVESIRVGDNYVEYDRSHFR